MFFAPAHISGPVMGRGGGMGGEMDTNLLTVIL